MKPKEMNTRFKFKELNDPLKEKKKIKFGDTTQTHNVEDI